MAWLKINVFNMMAAICTLLLVVYAWFMFLPTFEGLTQYSDVRNIITILSVLLIVVSGFQFYIAVQREEPKQEDQSPNSKEA